MRDWSWWLIAALVLGIAQVLTFDLILWMLAGGALAAALAAWLGAALWAQFVVFALVATVLLATLRPFLLRSMRARGPLPETGAVALVGREAVTVTEVSEGGGRVKLAGEVWTARVVGTPIAPGTAVEVVRIDGATAVVRRHPSGPGPVPAPAEEA